VENGDLVLSYDASYSDVDVDVVVVVVDYELIVVVSKWHRNKEKVKFRIACIASSLLPSSLPDKATLATQR